LLGILRQAVDALAVDREDAISGAKAYLGQSGGGHLIIDLQAGAAAGGGEAVARKGGFPLLRESALEGA
jgi:hypothetical protein